MIEALSDILHSTERQTEALLEEGRQQLNSMPSDAPAQLRWNFNRTHGNFLLREGQNTEAVRHLEEAYQTLPHLGDQISRAEYTDTMLDLSVGYLRIAETENCVHCRTGESCIFPIRKAGIHTQPQGSRSAIKYLEELLQEDSENLRARWLLNIAYMTLGKYPDQVPTSYVIDPQRFATDEDFPRFQNIAAALKLDTMSMSGGAICDDFDGDGDFDIVTSDWGPSGELLYFCNNGDSTFTNATQKSGLTGILGGLNLLQADYDNDGDLDFVVLRGAWLGEYGCWPNSLLRNNGSARFIDVAYSAGLAGTDHPTQTASWGDFDLDGWLDLYVGNEQQPCQLFHNNRDGSFTDVADAAGVRNDGFTKGFNGFTKGVIWGDFDQDRYPDLYVSNFKTKNRLYRNNRNGTFTDVAEEKGVTHPLQSFPVWFWDYNNDGLLDLWVGTSWWDQPAYALKSLAASYLGEPHDAELTGLYRGTSDGGFEEVASNHGLTQITMPMGCNFGDLDNDGYLDFCLGTGMPAYEALMPNVMYWNRQGERFTDVTTASGFGHLQKGHGICFADLDGDGDQDIFNQLGGAYPGDAFHDTLYENPGFDHTWLKIDLVGTRSNRFGVGTRIRLEIIEDGQKRTIFRHVNSGGSFGANPLQQHIGTGTAEQVKLMEVYWPASDSTQTFRNVAVNQTIEVTEEHTELRRRLADRL